MYVCCLIVYSVVRGLNDCVRVAYVRCACDARLCAVCLRVCTCFVRDSVWCVVYDCVYECQCCFASLLYGFVMCCLCCVA